MPTLLKQYGFDSDTWSKVSGGNLTPVYSSGEYSFAVSGRNDVGTGYIELTTTWESLGVPSGATINEIDSSQFDWRCDVWSADSDSYTYGQLAIHDNSGTLQATLISSQSGTGATSSATKSGGVVSIPSSIQASNSSIKIRLYGTADNGNAKTVDTGIKYDNLQFTIDYSSPAISISGEDISHSHNLGVGQISQSHSISGNNLGNSHVLSDSVISQYHEISGAGINHLQSISSGEFTQTTELNISGENIAHSNTLAGGDLSQIHTINGTDLTHTHTLTDGSISQSQVIEAENLTHIQSLGVGEISQTNIIEGEDLNHSQSLTTGTLSSEITISGNDLVHSQNLESGEITQGHEITSNDLNQSQSLSSGEVEQIHEIGGSNLSHTNELQSGLFYQVHIISGDNLSHTQTISVGEVTSYIYEPPEYGVKEIDCNVYRELIQSVTLNKSKEFTIFVERERVFNVKIESDE